MGVSWVLVTEAQVAAFAADWMMGMPLAEMAALHGYKNINNVSRRAQRMGLPKRSGGREPASLPPGRWLPGRHGILWFVPDLG